jgi:P4 family phage/plasmid primase-like protien
MLIFFNKHPIKYDPNMQCPNIVAFLKSILLNDKEIDVMEEVAGFTLYRNYFLEKAFMFLGSGRNGKGKYLLLLKHFLGKDNTSAIPVSHFDKDLFSVGEIFKKNANMCGDLSKEALTHSGTFKSVVARDNLSVPRKYKTRVSFVNYAKLIFATNELPMTFDITDAFFDRWIIITFPYRFLPQKDIDGLKEEEKKNIKLQDPEIIDKLTTQDELSGFLNLALEGLKRIKENKSFSFSPSTESIKRQWFRKSDSFLAFVMDKVEVAYDSFITKKALKQDYVQYCLKHKLSISSDKAINSIITKFGAVDERMTVDGHQVGVWANIKFKGQDTIKKEEEELKKQEEEIKSSTGNAPPQNDDEKLVRIKAHLKLLSKFRGGFDSEKLVSLTNAKISYLNTDELVGVVSLDTQIPISTLYDPLTLYSKKVSILTEHIKQPTLPVELLKVNFYDEILNILREQELTFTEIYDRFKEKVPKIDNLSFEVLIEVLLEKGDIFKVKGDKYKKV